MYSEQALVLKDLKLTFYKSEIISNVYLLVFNGLTDSSKSSILSLIGSDNVLCNLSVEIGTNFCAAPLPHILICAAAPLPPQPQTITNMAQFASFSLLAASQLISPLLAAAQGSLPYHLG